MGLQRARHNLTTEQQQQNSIYIIKRGWPTSTLGQHWEVPNDSNLESSWERVPGDVSVSPVRLQIAALEAPTCQQRFMVFPVVMYGCESWTIKKAEHKRIDAFELWCWRRLLRVPWTARRYNQSILKEINPESSLEGLMPKLKLQYFGHLMRRTDSCVRVVCNFLGSISKAIKIWQGGPVFQLSYN